ncbi:unnamed protein product [Danaus chrysippus]|uniref:(African queen) hypothetical protein n=1 Tax=Danaus chrysippus TaxID=151541 RepID=A0A8J2MHT3_9NEOP|nr:unnamed protein product [Danaus chrysippus]
MANDLNESLLNVPDSDEDEGLLNFSQYYFKEWSDIEALYKLTMYNESLNDKEEESGAAETSQSEDDSDMDKDSGEDEEEDYIEQLGNELDNMILSKPNLLYENPMRENSRFQIYSFCNNRVTTGQCWTWKPDQMDDDDSYESSSSDDETSSLSD